ncbi:MAG: DEAD/DEAH box helicase [Acidimicrobiia bacterium]|nr:DEAD/DEAH box helicase [Acidimicrobiia bacterium]
MTTSFAQLGLPDPLVRALATCGIDEPFAVQAATIPDALAGRDVSGRAPTGSGKTLAFGLPVLARVSPASQRRPSALILAPTRELAEQITQELRQVSGSVGRTVQAVYGGVAYGPQIKGLRSGADVLVATPGRLEDLIDQGAADLSRVTIVVIDEADRMADMGFMPAVRRLLDATASERQTLLFSATLDGEVAVLSRDYQTDPVLHQVGGDDESAVDIDHHFWLVDHDDRIQHTADVVTHAGRSIVFTRTRRRADRLARQLQNLGVDAIPIHGGRSQNQRTRALSAFAAGRADALIATDVAARGIHVDAVAAVVHFDPAGDAKDYLHRSGRTARAGATGTVVTLVAHDQRRAVRRLQRNLDLDHPIEAPRMDVLVEGRRPTPKPAHRVPRQQDAPGHSRSKGKPPHRAPRSVYVANLPWTTTSGQVESLFRPFGDVVQATIITDRSGRSRGFGFVDMPERDAKAAIAALHGTELEGRDLTVRFAQPRNAPGANRRKSRQQQRRRPARSGARRGRRR